MGRHGAEAGQFPEIRMNNLTYFVVVLHLSFSLSLLCSCSCCMLWSCHFQFTSVIIAYTCMISDIQSNVVPNLHMHRQPINVCCCTLFTHMRMFTPINVILNNPRDLDTRCGTPRSKLMMQQTVCHVHQCVGLQTIHSHVYTVPQLHSIHSHALNILPIYNITIWQHITHNNFLIKQNSICNSHRISTYIRLELWPPTTLHWSTPFCSATT